MSMQVLALALAGAAVIVAVASAGTSLWLFGRHCELQDARGRLDRAIDGLRRLQQARSPAAGSPDAPTVAANGAGLREHHLASALDALRHRKLGVSYLDYMVIAGALLASGRVGEAHKCYDRGCDRVEGRFGRASAQRAFGGVLFAAGQLDQGRRRLVAAGEAFLDLSQTPGFDHDAMVLQAFDTGHLLVQLELQGQVLGHAGEDLSRLCELACALRDPARAAAARRLLADLAADAERLRQGAVARDAAPAPLPPPAAEPRLEPPRPVKPDLMLVSG